MSDQVPLLLSMKEDRLALTKLSKVSILKVVILASVRNVKDTWLAH